MIVSKQKEMPKTVTLDRNGQLNETILWLYTIIAYSYIG